MLESFVLYVLSTYFLYWVLSKSDILRRPREYVLKSFPWWLTHPINCALCFAFWMGLALAGFIFLQVGVLALSTANLMAAPVGVMLIDLIVQRLAVAVTLYPSAKIEGIVVDKIQKETRKGGVPR